MSRRKVRHHRSGVQIRHVYIDGYGNEQDVENMDTSHIVNTIGYITGKMHNILVAQQALEAVNIRSGAIVARIQEQQESITALAEELICREDHSED